MWFSDVNRALGGGAIQTSRNVIGEGAYRIETESWEWRNPDGSTIVAIFQNGKLVQKAQSGLN